MAVERWRNAGAALGLGGPGPAGSCSAARSAVAARGLEDGGRGAGQWLAVRRTGGHTRSTARSGGSTTTGPLMAGPVCTSPTKAGGGWRTTWAAAGAAHGGGEQLSRIHHHRVDDVRIRGRWLRDGSIRRRRCRWDS